MSSIELAMPSRTGGNIGTGGVGGVSTHYFCDTWVVAPIAEGDGVGYRVNFAWPRLRVCFACVNMVGFVL